MPEQHIAIMKGLGFTDDQINTVETMTPEQLKEFKPDDLITGVQTNMKNVLSNDPAFLSSIPEDKIDKGILKKIESGQYARFQNELIEVATKKLGLEDKDLTADDRKSIKGLAEKMATVYLAKKGNVEGLQAMQKELAEAKQGLETLKGEHETNLTKALEETNGKNTAKLIRTLAKVELQDLPGVKLLVGAKMITEPVLAALNSKYTVVLNDDDSFDLKQKTNPALDVLDKAGKKVSFIQAMKEVVLENKLGTEIKEGEEGEEIDPTTGKPKKKKIIIDEGGGGGGGTETVIPAHIQAKINANPDKKD